MGSGIVGAGFPGVTAGIGGGADVDEHGQAAESLA